MRLRIEREGLYEDTFANYQEPTEESLPTDNDDNDDRGFIYNANLHWLRYAGGNEPKSDEQGYEAMVEAKCNKALADRWHERIRQTKIKLMDLELEMDEAKATNSVYGTISVNRTKAQRDLAELEHSLKLELEFRERFVADLHKRMPLLSRSERLKHYEKVRIRAMKGWNEFLLGTTPECWNNL